MNATNWSFNPAPMPAHPALVAVSGGRDSVALLHWLMQQPDCGPLIVCHLNHALRGNDSGQDAALVRRLAKKFRLPCEVEKIEVAELAEQTGDSVETTARRVRYDFFARMARKHHASTLYLAHHAEDQAETVLAHLCRGAGLNGLAGMKPEQKIKGLTLRRPLLQWRRHDINAYIHEHRLPFREDASNASPAHRRNRIRHEALPLLSEIFDRDVTPQLTQFAELAAADSAALDQISRDFLKTSGTLQPDHSLRATPELKKLHPAILSRVLRLWLRDTCSMPDLGAAEITAAMALLAQSSPAKINLPGGNHLRRKSGRLEVLSERPR